MEDENNQQPTPVTKTEISRWDRFTGTLLKSIRISYMNWTYLPRSTGEEETWKERLLRYSHFPMATQALAYFAYRAACQVYINLFLLSRTCSDVSSSTPPE